MGEGGIVVEVRVKQGDRQWWMAHVCRLPMPEFRQLRLEVKVSRALLRKESVKAGLPRGWPRSQIP
jgi:hypothetical protein